MVNTPPNQSWTPFQAAHLLNRAGFGGTPEEISRLHGMGREAAVESLLNGDDDSDLFPVPELMPAEEVAAYRREIKAIPDGPARREVTKKFQRRQGADIRAIREWWLRRCRYTAFPLREKMTLFWHGHFATSSDKVKSGFLMWQQNETLRAYALGSFRQLSEQIARDPAMMRYLDLDRSSKEKPNENFSRELMELFMLGEGVRYTEDDVRESARAFTGARIDPRNLGYISARRRFDSGQKEFLGQTGNFDGGDIVNIICDQPECAEFVSRKIWKYLAGREPTPALAGKLAATYRSSNYDTKTLLRTIFLSPEFYAPDVVRHEVKSPVQWLVQTSKVLEAPLFPPALNELAMRQLGQVLLAPPNVKGWEGGQTWINSSTFLLRCNLAGNMIHGDGMKGNGAPAKALPIEWEKVAPAALRNDPPKLVDALAFRFFNAPLRVEDRQRFIEFVNERGTDDAAIKDLVHLFLSTPEYQLT